MPKIKIFPHHEICPNGATIENLPGETVCEAALRNGIKIEHACEMSCACTTCHIVVRKGFNSLEEANDTKDTLSAEGLQRPDMADRAQVEADASIQLRTRDRERKLISKIDAALRRIDLKTYGYCEETGEPIGLGRLKARPIASLSVQAQERHEKNERVHKDE